MVLLVLLLATGAAVLDVLAAAGDLHTKKHKIKTRPKHVKIFPHFQWQFKQAPLAPDAPAGRGYDVDKGPGGKDHLASLHGGLAGDVNLVNEKDKNLLFLTNLQLNIKSVYLPAFLPINPDWQGRN